MTSLTHVLAGIAALSTTASARVFHSGPVVHNLHPRSDDGNNLIALRADGSATTVLDDTPVIRAAAGEEILRPIRPSKPRSGATTVSTSSKVAVPQSSYGLRKDGVFYWGGESGTMAELRVNMHGEQEALIDMEQFDDLVESLDCPQGDGKLSIRFKDQADFDSAADVWNWVNQEPDHHFVLLVGEGDCGWNDDRVLFHVDGLEFSDDVETAVLNAQRTSWKEAVHSFDLDIGKPASDSQLVRRGIDPSFSVPIDFDISGKGVSFNMDGVDYIGSCNNCTAVGSFDIEAHFSMEWFDISEASVSLSTPGISATAILDVTVKGELTDGLLEKSFPLFKASPAGISIPGIVTIGPTVTVALKAGVNAIKGGVKLTLGGTASIPPSTATLDFLNQDNTNSEGWEIQTEAVPLEADVFVEARAYTSLTPSVGLELSAFEHGFAAEVASDLPVLAGVVKAIHSLTCTACDQFENAVEGSVSLGTNIGVALKKKNGDTQEDLWSLTFFDASMPPLASFCEAVGPQNCGNNSTMKYRF
ncbi:hypothetical protein ACO1O0_005866 [Amphichorda felina]